MRLGLRFWQTKTEYRARATFGVALAALSLLFPFMILSIVQGRVVMAAGTGFVVLMLSINTWLVTRGRDYETVTLVVLVPCGMLFMTHVFRVDGIIGSVWCYPALLACYCMLSQRKAWIANVIILAIALPMIWTTMDPALSARFSATLIAVSLFAAILVREIDAQQHRLQYQIEHDPLTGLLNRTSLRGRLEASIIRRQTTGEPAALLTLDLDHFKQINDRFGHDTGDLVLCEIASLLRQHVQSEDAVFRLGGEEFLILLADTNGTLARARAEVLRVQIEQAAIVQHTPITASIGIAVLRATDDRSQWAKRSDDRLYKAKGAGRNRVVADDETTVTLGDIRLPKLAANTI